MVSLLCVCNVSISVVSLWCHYVSSALLAKWLRFFTSRYGEYWKLLPGSYSLLVSSGVTSSLLCQYLYCFIMVSLLYGCIVEFSVVTSWYHYYIFVMSFFSVSL